MPRGVIYFIEAIGTGFVKIGFTRQMAGKRMQDLQVACPHELKLLAWMEEFEPREATIHSRFHHLRHRGEWFKLDEALRSFILDVAAHPPHRGLI